MEQQGIIDSLCKSFFFYLQKKTKKRNNVNHYSRSFVTVAVLSSNSFLLRKK